MIFYSLNFKFFSNMRRLRVCLNYLTSKYIYISICNPLLILGQNYTIFVGKPLTTIAAAVIYCVQTFLDFATALNISASISVLFFLAVFIKSKEFNYKGLLFRYNRVRRYRRIFSIYNTNLNYQRPNYLYPHQSMIF